MDSKLIERARRVADESHRAPTRSPAEAAFLAAIIAAVLIVTYQLLDELMPRGWAEALTIGLVAAVTFLDGRQRWRRHTEIFSNELERLKEKEERGA